MKEALKFNLLFQGIVLGFSIAAPVGPIGVLCIRRTLAEGWTHGLASGLGAATADAIYGSVAGFGLTVVSGLLIRQQTWLRLVGGAFLCYLGLKTLWARPAEKVATAQERGLLGAYSSTFVLTLTNPMTILAFTAIFAGLGVASGKGDYAQAGALILGVFAGSALWWLLLSSVAGLLRTRFSLHGLTWVNRISGLVITSFGAASLLSLL